MLIIDTDHWTELCRHESVAAENLRDRLILSGERIATTIVTAEEGLRGWLSEIHAESDPAKQTHAYAKLKEIIDALNGWELLPWNDAAIEAFESIKYLRTKIGAMDLKIASVALSRQTKLLSRNLKDFQRVPGLVVEDWLS